jgi:hypothetical protein
MKRDYTDGVKEDVVFFVGNEVEHTPAFGMRTLFVTGIQPVDEIAYHFDKHPDGIEHIFFGANHSYNPQNYDEHKAWENMIRFFLEKDYLCSLDIPLNQVEAFNDSGLCESDNFIPQIRVPIPYVKLWNYNTMLKIDDKDFKATNPGVWTHSLHALQDRSKFTPWNKYKDDKAL